MRLNEAQIINPSKPIQFRAASWLAAQTPRKTAGILSEVSRRNVGRAGTLLVDINNLAGADFSAKTLSSLSSAEKQAIVRFIKRMPTLDAARFRIDILGTRAADALAPSHAAWDMIDPSTSSNREYRAHIYEDFSSEIGKIVSAAGAHRNMFKTPVLGGQDNFAGFYSWAAKTFLPENYGYQSVSDRIIAVSGDVAPPKTKHLDGKKDQFHQCFHTAVAARGYFSQQGIPAEVYCFTVNGYGSHNAAVVFQENGDKFTPVLVDASPFRGGYTLQSATDFRPFDWEGISTVNDFEYPLIRKTSMWSKSPGGLPWACIPLKNGMNSILNVEILEQLKYPARAWERGTPEYYGHGQTVRSTGFSVGIIMPDKDDCFDMDLPIRNNGGKRPVNIKDVSKYDLEKFSKKVGSQELLELMIEAAQCPAKRFLELIERFGLM